MRSAVVLFHIGWQVKSSTGSCGRPRCHRRFEHEKGFRRCLFSGEGAVNFFQESLVTIGRVNLRKTQRKAAISILTDF